MERRRCRAWVSGLHAFVSSTRTGVMSNHIRELTRRRGGRSSRSLDRFTRGHGLAPAVKDLQDAGDVLGGGGVAFNFDHEGQRTGDFGGVLIFDTGAGGIGGDGGEGAAIADGGKDAVAASGSALDKGAVERDVGVVGYCLGGGRDGEE